MLDRIIHFSIHNKLVIGLLTLMLVAWGAYSTLKLPIDAVPDITNNQVQVYTYSPALAPQDIERKITQPIELAMANLPGKEEIRSISRFGLSVVTIVFKEDMDIYQARQLVSEGLQTATSSIPASLGTPQMAPITTGLGEIYQYTLDVDPAYQKKYSPTDLRSIQDWIVKRQLNGTQGVADISSFGGYLKQYEIALNPERLRAMNVSLEEVYNCLNTTNDNSGGAYIEKGHNVHFIRTEGNIKSLEELENLMVLTDDGRTIRLPDLGTVHLGHAVRYGALTKDTTGETVGGLVLMRKGENSSEVISNVKTRIEQISKSLPPGIRINAYLDRTRLVNNSIQTVLTNLTEGALIVIFVLVLLLGNWRAGFIVASVIPLAMLFAVSMMHLFGVSGNLMSLGAIDFGLIVDGTVIIVEAVLHQMHVRLPQGGQLQREDMQEHIYLSASRIRSSAAFGEIIILVVYLPILALSGIEGKMFKPMAQTVSFAILGAFILSMTYVPMMCALVLSRRVNPKPTLSDRLISFLQKLYLPVLVRALKLKGLVITVSLVLLSGALTLFAFMGGEFIPTLEEGDFAVETRLLTGSSISETVSAANKASKILLQKFPEVNQVVGKIGTAEIPVDPMPMESCDLMIILKDKAEWTSASDREELVGKMQEALKDIPGVTFGFQQPIQMRFNELMSGARQDVVIKIFGDDPVLLQSYSKKLGQLLKKVKGAEDIFVEPLEGLPQVIIRPRTADLGRHQLTVQEVNHVVQSAFSGAYANPIYEGDKKFDLVLRLTDSSRKDLNTLQNLALRNKKGMLVPLAQVADITYESGPNQIQREDTKRRTLVGFNVRGRDVQSLVEEVNQLTYDQLPMVPGYHLSIGGAFRNLEEAKFRLYIAVPVALLLIFTLLFFTLHKVWYCILILSAIPLASIGGILALWMRGMPFSISAGVGFIALFGVAVLNGIVLISTFLQLRKENLPLRETILKGAKERLRPVLLTALVASLGFLPMALSGSSGAEVQKPLATVVIGGLLSSTLLTLFVLPVLFELFEKDKPHELSK